MRLIDADELLEHAYRDRLNSRELIIDMINNAPTVKEIPVNVPIDLIIKALEKEPKTDWIPVSEGLPEDGTWNLWTDGKQISVERFKLDAMNHFYPSGRWFTLEEAIAWMPLPTPWKGK